MQAVTTTSKAQKSAITSKHANATSHTSSAMDRGMQGRYIGNQGLIAAKSNRPFPIQAKLKVGRSDDVHEKEADRIADTVMRTPSISKVNTSTISASLLQRKCKQCEEDDINVQRKEIASPSKAKFNNASDSVNAVLKQNGRPLSAGERAFFEPRFARDFSRVRIHDSEHAANAADILNARAFTVGSQIAFGAGQYTPQSERSQRLMAHELTHTIQQTDEQQLKRKEIIQRAQIGRVNIPPAGTPHFIYELDAAMSTFSQLADHYGVSTRAVQNANPGRSARRLRLGQQINIPANNAPITMPPLIIFSPPFFMMSLTSAGMVHSTTTASVNVRWNTGGASNRVGRLPRGSAISMHLFGNGGAYIDIASLQNQASGILDELRLRGITTATHVFAYLPLANIRMTGTITAAADINLIARMIWGEQRNQGSAAMAAAAWIARNRFDAGWGYYNQIITQQQFHGLATPAQVTGLVGSNLVAWTDAQRIAQGVIDGTIADTTGGAIYFGNGVSVLRRMNACARRNAAYTVATIAGTNFHYSNGDYTSAACTIP